MNKAATLHAKLAGQGIRMFSLELDGDRQTVIHQSKTVSEWRSDLKGIIDSLEETGVSSMECKIIEQLRGLGYHEVCDVVSDSYEGEIEMKYVRVVDYKSHDYQVDGFGHFGWESKTMGE